MKTISLFQATRVFFAAFMLASLFLVFQVSSSQSQLPSAQAAEVTCSGQAVCIGTVARTVTGGGGWGAPIFTTPGSPVGSAPAPQVPQVTNPLTGQSLPAWETNFVYRAWQIPMLACAPKTLNGVSYQARGVIYEYRRNLITSGMFGYGQWIVVNSTCVYPEVTNTQTSRTCIIDYTARIDRLGQSWLGAANGVGSTSGTKGNVGDLESNGAANCTEETNVAFSYNPPNGQDGWGQYRSTSSIRQVTCNFVTTTFDGASETKGKCGPLQTVQGSQGRLTIWCDGAVNEWVIKDWTGSDCQNGSRARLNCTIPDPAKYNGYAGNVQGIRDGADGTVLWGTPQVQGGWGMANWRSSTVINAGSTPRNTAVNDNSNDRQLFKSSVPFSSHMIAGQNLNQKLAFYTAGDAGSPFSMTRNYLYDSWFTSIHTEVRSIDLKSGNIGLASYTENTYAVDNKCGPQVSPRIDVIRAIGDTVKK